MLGLLLLAVLLIIVDVYFETHFPKVETVTLQTDKMPAGESLKILQVSDVHGMIFRNNNQDFLQMIREQDADVIALTGDLVDDSTREFGAIFTFVESLVKINQNVLYISGNHEWRHPLREEILAGLEARDVVMLNNAHTQVKKGDLVFNVVGVDDPSTGHEDLQLAYEGVNTEGYYTVLLAHAPELIFRQSVIPADLILSGHTHGGQVRLPFVGAVVAPGQGFFPKYDKGVFPLEHGTTLYIDSGVGTSVWPLRFMNRSQITLLTIQGTKK